MNSSLLRLSVWLLFCFAIVACSDDKPDTENLPVIDDGLITLTEFDLPLKLEEIKDNFIHLEIKNKRTGRIFTEETTVSRFANYLRFKLKFGLPDGDFVLLSAVCYPDNDDIAYEASMGMSVAVRGGELEVTSSFNEEFEFYGEGSYDDPFIIASVKDLNRLKKHVNEDFGNSFAGYCFRQEKTLDLSNQDYTTGWEPIASFVASPFSGVYDGGGYEIKGLWIETPEVSGRGLFGFSLGATFRNITLVSPRINADGYSGGLLGVAITEGKSRMQTRIENCKVTGSGSINGNVGMGALVGGVDQSSMLMVSHCSNEVPVKASLGAGGLVGAGVVSSRILFDNCENRGTVNAVNGTTISGIGGIIGAADTITVARSVNYGSVYAPDYADAKGIGGITGSSGFALFAVCTNKGTVSGGRGVGGILGSTVLEMENPKEGTNATYNSATFTGCSNQNEIKAYKMAGGIVGESQTLINGCYNVSPVSATDAYAGGIVGLASTLIAENCLNTGRVTGNGYVGGIVSAAYFNQLVGNYNFGEVSTSGEDAVIGGIIGHSGNNTALHYCGNYGRITHTGSKGAAGGITGQLGNVRTFSPYDICSIVFTSVSLVLTPVTGAIDIYSGGLPTGGGKRPKYAKAFQVVGYVNQGITWAFNIHDIVNWAIPDDPDAVAPKVDMEQLAAEFKVAVDNMVKEKQMVFNTELTSFKQRNQVYASMNEQVKESQNTFCTRLQGDDSYFTQVNGKLFDYKESRREVQEEKKESYDLAMNILNCVIFAASIAAFIVANVATAGGATAVAATIAGVVIGTVGGTNGLVHTARDFEENASVIEQCFNQGNLDIPKEDVFGGGITGKLNDYGEIKNCFNTGTLQQKEDNRKGGITGYMGDKINVNSTVNYATWSNPKYGTTTGAADPVYSINHCKVYYLDDKSNNSGGRTEEELKNPTTFNGFLETAYWIMEEGQLPVHTPVSCFEN